MRKASCCGVGMLVGAGLVGLGLGGCDPEGNSERGPGAWEDADGESVETPAGDPSDLPTSEIYGGTQVASCGWPTTVNLGGACSGTLVAPDVVVYAAHCGDDYDEVRLGENAFSGAGRWVATERCEVYPGGGPGGGDDFAYCVLAQPVHDVPIVPVLMGCETEVLQPGASVTIVGFGNANTGPYGIKREVKAPIVGISNSGEIRVGGNGKDSCQGDSGGPVFAQLDDGTWRVFGITSYGGACGTGGYYSMMHNGMAWFEARTGRDLTPCHDADGTWNPTAACSDFPVDPGVGHGVWSAGCGGGDRSGPSATCGGAFGGGSGGADDDAGDADPVPGEVFAGSLSGSNDQAYEPHGTYWLAQAGRHQATLSGPSGTDFDLYLYAWQGGQWRSVAQSTSASSSETVGYDGAKGYYIWMVKSYRGAGSYSLSLVRP